MPSNHLILCCSLLLLALSFPSIGVFPNDSAVRIKWPKYWSFSFSISLSNDYSWLISFRIDWSDLLAVWPSVNQRVRPGSHPSLIAIWRNQPCWHLDFELPASRLWDKEFLIKLHSPWYFAMAASANQYRQHSQVCNSVPNNIVTIYIKEKATRTSLMNAQKYWVTLRGRLDLGPWTPRQLMVGLQGVWMSWSS